MKSITSPATAQSRRAERAATEAPSYTFRRTTIAGIPAVYVINPATEQIYTVHSGNRCNCPDAQHRGLKHGFDCKHAVAARNWLASLEVADRPAGDATSHTEEPAVQSLFASAPPARRAFRILPPSANAAANRDRELWD